MSALIALGPAVLDECLLPQMDQYLTSTKDKVSTRKKLLALCTYLCFFCFDQTPGSELFKNNYISTLYSDLLPVTCSKDENKQKIG